MFFLHTPRLVLRELLVSDAEYIYALNLDPEVIRYTADGPFADVAEARRFLETYDHYQRYGMGRWAVVLRNAGIWIGWCGLKYDEDTDEVDLGYRFFRKYWGNGYATEAGLVCIEYGFRELQLPKIIGRVQDGNHASVRVLEKLGFDQWQAARFDGQDGVVGTINNPYFHARI